MVIHSDYTLISKQDLRPLKIVPGLTIQMHFYTSKVVVSMSCGWL